MKLSVVGLGKLGACLLGVAASKFEVVGVDLDGRTVQKLNSGIAPVTEPGLQELLTQNRARYRASVDFKDVADTDITFVIVPTPSVETGKFDNRMVTAAVTGIANAIKKKKKFHLIVIVSTVMPGSTAGPISHVLKTVLGPPGPRWEICYSPEFIALGSVIRDMQNPDMLLIGAQSPHGHFLLEKVMRAIVGRKVPVAKLSLHEAEVAKLMLNCFVTMKISFANSLAELCESVPGVDASNVAAAIGMDSRVGSKYMRPASSFGGPCFPRDNQALMAFASAQGVRMPLAESTVDVNDRQIGRIVNMVEKITPLDDPVGLLGMAFKPDTPVATCSTGMRLAEELLERGFEVVVYDRLAMDEVVQKWGQLLTYMPSPDAVVDYCSTVVVTQPCHEFGSVDPAKTKVIDLWNVVEAPGSFRPGLYRMGMP